MTHNLASSFTHLASPSYGWHCPLSPIGAAAMMLGDDQLVDARVLLLAYANDTDNDEQLENMLLEAGVQSLTIVTQRYHETDKDHRVSTITSDVFFNMLKGEGEYDNLIYDLILGGEIALEALLAGELLQQLHGLLDSDGFIIQTAAVAPEEGLDISVQLDTTLAQCFGHCEWLFTQPLSGYWAYGIDDDPSDLVDAEMEWLELPETNNTLTPPTFLVLLCGPYRIERAMASTIIEGRLVSSSTPQPGQACTHQKQTANTAIKIDTDRTLEIAALSPSSSFAAAKMVGKDQPPQWGSHENQALRQQLAAALDNIVKQEQEIARLRGWLSDRRDMI